MDLYSDYPKYMPAMHAAAVFDWRRVGGCLNYYTCTVIKKSFSKRFE